MSSVRWEPPESVRTIGVAVRIPTANRQVIAKLLARPSIVQLHWCQPFQTVQSSRGRSVPCLRNGCLFCANGSEAFPYGYAPALEFDRADKRWKKIVLGLCRSFLKPLETIAEYIGHPVLFKVEKPNLKTMIYHAELATFPLPKSDDIPPFDVRPQLEALWGHYANGQIHSPKIGNNGSGQDGVSA